MTVDHATEAARLHVDQPWRKHAACHGRARTMDPTAEEMKTARLVGLERHLWREAKDICWACPVLSECRAWVLSLPAADDVTGVCGAMTEEDRRRERRRRGQRTGQRAVRAKETPAVLAAANAASTRAAGERFERFVRLRGKGRSIEQAARVLGVSAKTAGRYEARRRRTEG